MTKIQKDGVRHIKEAGIHHMGKRTGYTLIDGEYRIAPAYILQFDAFTAQRAGIDEMLCSVTKHAAKTLEVIASQNKKLWDEIIDDIGLDASMEWGYYHNGVIKKREKK